MRIPYRSLYIHSHIKLQEVMEMTTGEKYIVRNRVTPLNLLSISSASAKAVTNRAGVTNNVYFRVNRSEM